MSTGVSPLQSLLALKAIGLMPGLTSAERRVACAIVEHFNRRNGRCDPGMERLRNLLGMSRSTVIRSVGALHRANIIRRVPHGGRSQRNEYEPNWELLEEYQRSWTRRFAVTLPAEAVSDTPPARCQGRHLGGGTAATQTYDTNLPVEPAAAAPPKNDRIGSESGKSANGLAGRREWSGRHHPTADRSQAAKTAAIRRWDQDLRDRFKDSPDAYGAVINMIDQALEDAATQAELRRRGAGVDLILERLAQGGHGSSRGPLPGAGISGPDDTPVRPRDP